MSGTLNKVMLIGHLGDDVKLRYFEDGGCIGRFPLATNETYTNRQSGERVSQTEWHNILVRNKAAETCEKYLKKGDRVYIEGRLKTRKWQDDNGNDRYSTEIICTDFTFLTAKNEQTQQTGNSTPVNNTTAPTQTATSNNEGADDLPF